MPNKSYFVDGTGHNHLVSKDRIIFLQINVIFYFPGILCINCPIILHIVDCRMESLGAVMMNVR